MNQKTESPAEIHADHRRWKSEFSIWRDDIEQWKGQRNAAIKQLEEITELIRHHGIVLHKHVDLNDKVSNGVDFHEKNLAERLQSGLESELDDTTVKRHADQANAFAKQRNAHERIKKYHHVAMAHVASLKAAFDAAM